MSVCACVCVTRRFDLAVQLGDLEVASSIAETVNAEPKWRQLVRVHTNDNVACLPWSIQFLASVLLCRGVSRLYVCVYVCVRVQGELAMTAGHLHMAAQCLGKAKDYSGLLLMRGYVHVHTHRHTQGANDAACECIRCTCMS